MAEKIISFKIQSNGEEKNPRWVRAKTENDICPQCASRMVVIMASSGQDSQFLYAFCPKCQETFIAE